MREGKGEGGMIHFNQQLMHSSCMSVLACTTARWLPVVMLRRWCMQYRLLLLSGRSLDIVVSIISLLEFSCVVSITGRLSVTQLDADTHGDATAAEEVARYIDDDDDDQDDSNSDRNHCPQTE